MAVKDVNDPNKKSRALYGHVVDVVGDTVKFCRYISNHGVRNIYDNEISINSLLGVYRYELGIEEGPLPKEDEKPVEENTQE